MKRGVAFLKMDIIIVSSLPAFTGLLRENMAHPEPAGGMDAFIMGKLGGWEISLVSWEQDPLYYPQPDWQEVYCIIGVGQVQTPLPYLKAQDILLSGEVHLEGGQVYTSHHQLIDLALKAGEELAEVQPGKVLVAQLWATAPQGETLPGLFAVGSQQSRVAALAREQGIPFLLLSTIVASGESKGESEIAKKVFWMVKGTLESLRHSGSRKPEA